MPILNTQASVFRLRTEILWFAQDLCSHMIFIDNIDLNDLYEQDKLQITLVDHHYLNSKLNKVVIEIIDHHKARKDSISSHEYNT